MSSTESAKQSLGIDFLTRLNEHFMDYVTRKEPHLAADYATDVEGGKISEDQARLSVEKDIDDLVNLPPEQRIRELLNNFRFNFSGGYYRQMFADNIAEGVLKDEYIVENKKMLEDLDSTVHELGFDSDVEAIIGENGPKDIRLLEEQAEVFFKMLEKGYDIQRLRV